jgi:PAS domain S-box-containing protein
MAKPKTSRLAAAPLALERERLLLAAAASGSGIWDYDIDADVLQCDERWYEILGLDPTRTPVNSIADFKPYIHPEDVERATEVKATMADLVAKKQNYNITFRIIRPDGALCWIRSAACLVLGGPDGRNRAVGAIFDITDQVANTNALARNECLFRAMADTLPQIVFSSRPDGANDFLNRRWHEFTGAPEGPLDADAWARYLHPDDRTRVFDAWARAVATGEGYDIDYRYRHHSGAYRWSRAMALPLRDDDGQIVRWFGSSTDIHEAKLLQAERDLVARELDHRVKNFFAVVTALVKLSAQAEPEMAGFAERVVKKIGSLHTAHNLIWRTGAGGANSIHELVRVLLTPFDDEANPRIVVDGEDMKVGDRAVTPLALIFHELATNATKYGALQNHSDALHVGFERGARDLVVTWSEISSVKRELPPDGQGFGSKLLAVLIERQLQGAIARNWTDNGVCIVLRLPLSALSSGA